VRIQIDEAVLGRLLGLLSKHPGKVLRIRQEGCS